MAAPVVVLDTCEYEVKDGGTCVLRGWMYAGEAPVSAEAGADQVSLECTLTRHARLDVLETRKDLPFPDERAGFEVRVRGIEPLFSGHGSLWARVRIGEESFPLIEKDMEQVREAFYRDTIRYHIEILTNLLGNVHIQGWCVNTAGELSLEFLDEDGQSIEDVQIHPMRRDDVMELYGVERENVSGFGIDVPRSHIHGNQLRFVLRNQAARREELIDMKKFDRDNTRLHRVLDVLGKKNRKRNGEILKNEGLRGFYEYVREESSTLMEVYGDYQRKHRASGKELAAQAREVFSPAHLFSIVVPLYHTPLPYLKELLDSIAGQSYANWELCLADGSRDDSIGEYIQKKYGKEKRIHYRHLSENTGISGNTNEALAMARGDFVVFADHDDMIERDALYMAACVLRDHPDTEMIYTDEDLVSEKGVCLYPHLKPDFNLDYLRCINYICHLTIVKRQVLDKVGNLRSEYDGAQDYDLILRCAEQIRPENIRHIPKMLYHWRSHEGSTAGNQNSKQYAVDAGKKALEEHYRRLGLEAEVEFTGIFIVFRTKFKIQGNPKVSVLIPNKDHGEDLEKCVVSVEEKSTWKNLEIVIIENNSEKLETFALYDELKQRYGNIRVVTYAGAFNYSAINNFGALCADGDYLVLLNNDTEVIAPDWLERMLGYCQREDVGAAGAKLLYPDDTVQHAGIVIGMGGFAGHILTGFGKTYTGYMGRLRTAQEISAVTGACLMTKRSVFEQLSGLDAENFAVALNDVDFCLRVRELGKHVVFVPEAELYHYESKSRGYETTPEKQARFQGEIRRFQERHAQILRDGDPYYNPNLSLVRGDCSLRKARESVKGIDES